MCKVATLWKLLQKGKRWEWLKQHEDCFRTVELESCRNILKIHPDRSKNFVITVDTSTVETAAVLMQDQGGYKKLIGLSENVLKPCETRYTIIEIEMLAIVVAIRKLRSAFLGQRTTVYSQNQTLVHYQRIKLILPLILQLILPLVPRTTRRRHSN